MAVRQPAKSAVAAASYRVGNLCRRFCETFTLTLYPLYQSGIVRVVTDVCLLANVESIKPPDPDAEDLSDAGVLHASEITAIDTNHRRSVRMQPQRLLTFLLTLLLSVTSLAGPQASRSPSAGDDFPTELKTDDVEPAIDLPEHKGKSPFRRVSSTRRQDSRDKLVTLCQEAVDTTARRMLSTDQHTPWQIMHALLGLREDFQILHNGAPVSGLDWVSQGQVFTNEYWFEKTKYGGRAHPYSVPYAFEGHANQFLAIMSMCGVGLDHTLGTANGPVTMRQMIQHAQMTVSAKDEPTWTLWLLSRYLPSNATWRNEAGEAWSIEKLVQIQTGKPMQGAPCGGTHSLFALAHARNVYLRQGKPLRGVWMQAEWKIQKHIRTARMQQNSNGTLSSNFFRGKKYDPDFNKRMASAGHVLEFLMIALPQKELNQLWVRRAIEATARDLLNNRKEFVKCSPLYHSVNALNIYLDRVNPKVKVDNFASEPEPLRTAQAPAAPSDATARLKTVPFRGISKSRDAAAPEDAAEMTTPGTEEPEPALTADAAPLRRTPTVSEELSPEALTEEDIQAHADGWKATPPQRRQGFAVPPEKENAEQSIPAPPRQVRETPTELKSAEDAQQATEPMPQSAAATESLLPVEPQNEPAEPAPGTLADPATPDPINGELIDLEAEDSTPQPKQRKPSVPVKSVSMPRPAPIVPLEKPEGTVDSFPNPFKIPTETPEAETPVEKDNAEVAEPNETAEPGETPETTPPVETPEPVAAPTVDELSVDEPTATAEQSAVVDESATATVPAPAQDVAVKAVDDEPESKIPEGINDRFLDPDLDPAEWVSRFEIESREIFAGRKEILNAIGLKPGMSIADVGAGTGLFVGLFSSAVGPDGHVYSVDISPRLVDFVRRRVKSEGLANVEVIQSEEKSTKLGDRKVDRVFVCDTYHHFEHYKLMLASILGALKPGGEFILIDFDRIPGTSREWLLGHVRADKATFRAEVEAAGFEFVEEVKITEFKENYLLRFRKPLK